MKKLCECGREYRFTSQSNGRCARCNKQERDARHEEARRQSMTAEERRAFNHARWLKRKKKLRESGRAGRAPAPIIEPGLTQPKGSV